MLIGSGKDAFILHLLNFYLTLFSDLVDQVSLLFFIGQNGLHELDADYIAVSYVKGHILLTWDLGSGPRCGQ